jgi:hypothetical protein
MESISQELLKTIAMLLSHRDNCNYTFKGMVFLEDGMRLHFQDEVAGKGAAILPKEIKAILASAVSEAVKEECQDMTEFQKELVQLGWGKVFDPDTNSVLWFDSVTQQSMTEKDAYDLVDRRKDDPELCHCGSGLYKTPLHDARGIFCAYVCDRCEEEKRSRYRLEIFEDSNYICDEPIDED